MRGLTCHLLSLAISRTHQVAQISINYLGPNSFLVVCGSVHYYLVFLPQKRASHFFQTSADTVPPVHRVVPAQIARAQNPYRAGSQTALHTQSMHKSFGVPTRPDTPVALSRGKFCYGLRADNEYVNNLHWQTYF